MQLVRSPAFSSGLHVVLMGCICQEGFYASSIILVGAVRVLYMYSKLGEQCRMCVERVHVRIVVFDGEKQSLTEVKFAMNM